jgi:hypothetical protein
VGGLIVLPIVARRRAKRTRARDARRAARKAKQGRELLQRIQRLIDPEMRNLGEDVVDATVEETFEPEPEPDPPE